MPSSRQAHSHVDAHTKGHKDRWKILKNAARLKETGTRWNQRCLLFQWVLICNIRLCSFTSTSIFMPSWYALICIVKFNIFEIKLNFEKRWGYWNSKIHAFRLNQTYHPHKKCQMYVNKTIFTQQWHHSLCNNHYGASVFPIGTNFVLIVQVSQKCILSHLLDGQKHKNVCSPHICVDL